MAYTIAVHLHETTVDTECYWHESEQANTDIVIHLLNKFISVFHLYTLALAPHCNNLAKRVTQTPHFIIYDYIRM